MAIHFLLRILQAGTAEVVILSTVVEVEVLAARRIRLSSVGLSPGFRKSGQYHKRAAG